VKCGNSGDHPKGNSSVATSSTGTATRRFLHADERGSIIAITASDGSL
jgi:hypothetical protein